MTERQVVTVDGHQLSLVNLSKVMYRAAGTTKAAVIDYYARVAPTLLTYLADRPVTLVRYPDGVEAGHFFEKNCPPHAPEWVRTVAVATSRRTDGTGFRWGSQHGASTAPREDPDGSVTRFCVIEDRPTLIWAANLAALELHPYLHRTTDLDRPTVVVFDLDPGPPAGLVDAARVALDIRDLLDGLGLVCQAKTSGGKGVQVYLPLNTPVTYGQTSRFARAVARLLARRHPRRVTANVRSDQRVGKVLVDWDQNSHHKTTVAAYSLRARSSPTVSTPVAWREVRVAVEAGDADRLTFTPEEVLSRVDAHGDLFEPVARLEQSLPEL